MAVEVAGEVDGEYQQAAGFAEVEVAAGGLVTLRHRIVGDEDEAASEFFGFCADGFLGCGDEGGDENASVGGSVEPALPVALSLSGGVGAMNDHLLFEGIAKELEIAIGLQSYRFERLIRP